MSNNYVLGRRRKLRVGRVIGIVILSLITLPWLGLEGYFLATLYKAYAAKNWLTTEGIVTTSHIQSYGGFKAGCGVIDFEYRYTINGQAYTSASSAGSFADNYMFGGAGCGADEAHRFVDGNPIGSKIMVHYEPDNPSTSVIIAGKLSRNSWMGLFVPLTLLLISLGLLAKVLYETFHRYTPQEIAQMKKRLETMRAECPDSPMVKAREKDILDIENG